MSVLELAGIAKHFGAIQALRGVPQGLLQGKKVYVALARGGLYRDTPSDSQVPYLKSVLAFLGMTDVEFVYAEGLAMGAEGADKAFAAAQARIGELIA
jgi:FMN-dependent NADH-azoreductase